MMQIQPATIQDSFAQNPRRLQEMRGRPLADRIYDLVFQHTAIKRDNMQIDKFFAVDVVLRLPNGMVMTGQEKFLSHEYAGFHSLTVEYMQNAATGERGDWFRLPPMFYFVGYFTEAGDAFDPWIVINWPQLVLASNCDLVPWKDGANKDGVARANFKYVNLNDIPTSCVIAQSEPCWR